jgi:23S rRNA (guanosine2251-2'-O)-methyltransferase
VAKKPAWIIEKERGRKAVAAETFWLFGIHAVRDALANPARVKLRLVVTRNALDRLGEGVSAAGLTPEIADPRKFPVPLDPGSVHQGAALEVRALDWGSLDNLALADGPGAPRLVLLDRVSDPHNVGAILRSAEVFGARAVLAPARHSATETGALAKTASGALERQP